MAAAEQSSEPRRDYASPATWGDVETLRRAVDARIEQFEYRQQTRLAVARAEAEREAAEREIRRLRWVLVAVTVGGVAALGFLFGIL